MYVSESSTWRRRRLRRQRLTMAVIVLLVVAVGVAAFGYRRGWFADPTVDVNAGALPPCPAPSPTALQPADVHVNVYNSTSRNGLAASVAADLDKRSFAVETVANDPLHANVAGTALVRYGAAGVEAAKLVRAQVPKAKVHRDKREGTDVDLVIGDAFRSLTPVATPTTTTAAPTPTARCTPAGTPSSGTPSSGESSGTPSATATATG